MVVLTTVLATLGTLAPGAHAATGQVTGTVFDDANRNGIQDPAEAPFANIKIYAHVPGGSFVASGTTDSAGRYSISGLTDGNNYTIQIAAVSWNTYKNDWVATTTGSIAPQTLATAPASVDFGLRRIVRTTDYNNPMSSFVASNGLKVKSCDDAVTATEIFDALQRGLVGAEAKYVTVLFDCGSNDVTTTAVSGSAGTFSNYQASVWVTYSSWASSGDRTLTHEYGHAWSLYFDYMVQQDGKFSSYLEARGLTGDTRLGTTHAWNRGEMIAEDYRQLLGSPTAAAYAQENKEIPFAADVPGLRAFLADTFTTQRVSTTGTTTQPPPAAPIAISSLTMNPDPVKTTGTVSFMLNRAASVTVTIRDSKGATVKTLASNAAALTGSNSIVWDKTNDRGRKVGRGTYSVVVEAQASDGTAATASVAFSAA
jgi:hypothetical protein